MLVMYGAMLVSVMSFQQDAMKLTNSRMVNLEFTQSLGKA
jgi:hypothetical protein